MELISERQAARHLAARGLSLSASQHLLATGIAGAPIRTASTTLYDAAAVAELAARSPVSDFETKELLPDGAVVVRLPRGRSVAVSDSWPATVEVLRGPWPLQLGPMWAVLRWHWTGRSVPVLLTVSGFVMSGATIKELGAPAGDEDQTGTYFELDPPGPWLAGVRGRLLAFGRGATVELLGEMAWVRKNRSGRSAERARR